MWTRFDGGRWRADPIPHRTACTDRNCAILDGEPAHDSTSHYLLRTGGELRELHVEDGRATLHVYEADELVDGHPLALAAHTRTVELGPGHWTADVAWKALEEA